ncbi:ABC transporter substrate-binding protein [Cellulomonas citrea]|uniref:ABC transporter substrate-binding protein n=1 Tax=Cellulomonas citrea TaxID=1909423 RepID=UPI001F2484D7|nr:extracellular solute-binding protein [Cellulomonas citrea]
MRKSRKVWAAAAGLTGIALVATGCSSGGASSSQTSGGKVTLKVQTFNEFGYADLFTEYMKDHPEVTIISDKAAKSDDARASVKNAIATNTVTDDIVAADVDWMPELLASSSFFADVASDSNKGRWPDWKSAQATDSSGKLIGLGTDSGPQGVCYRKDLFAKAGLPTDRAAVAQLLGGSSATWDQYFATGQKFMAANTGAAWFDSLGALAQVANNQQAEPFESKSDDKITVADSGSSAQKIFTMLTSHTDQSAHLAQWTDDWTKAFAGDKFATVMCPAWMTQIISGDAPDQTNWDIADVLPGGASNWGGSFLLVPAGGAHATEAKALADWLTDPAQAAKVFVKFGNFPSQVAAVKDQSVTSKTDKYFNNAPTGEIFSNRFSAVSKQPYRGSHYFDINDQFGKALTRVDVDKTDTPDASWQKFLDAVKQLS